MTYALLISVFIISSCGLVYELIAGTLASYLLGDSVTQFSTIIGTYLFSMGMGSYLSRYIGKGLVSKFILIELFVGIIGGYSAAALFLSLLVCQLLPDHSLFFGFNHWRPRGTGNSASAENSKGATRL